MQGPQLDVAIDVFSLPTVCTAPPSTLKASQQGEFRGQFPSPPHLVRFFISPRPASGVNGGFSSSVLSSAYAGQQKQWQ